MSRQRITSMAHPETDGLLFGRASHPVTTRSGLVIGGGTVYPEINFTLPPLLITDDSMDAICAEYRAIIAGICARAADLAVPGFVAEIELLPPMTLHPDWGVAVCRAVVETLQAATAASGIPAAVRITPVDVREGRDLKHLWRGPQWDQVMATLAGCADAGAELLAIESVGGKEVHDEAAMYADLPKSIFALSVLGTLDMEHLWTAIVDVAEAHDAIPSGDTACGFANTAMVLAEKKYIPKVFAATVRVVSAVRSLVAVECGARGPHKDCGYEGLYVKAMTGIPIAMEGRMAACAHFSSVGNIAACAADLWSNESIQDVPLLAGPAPSVSFEQLAYDARLLNQALAAGDDAARLVRDLHADSDSRLDPQAYVLRPDVAVRVASELVKVADDYERGCLAARLALAELRAAHSAGALVLDEREADWLETLSRVADDLPATPEELEARVAADSEAYDPTRYDR